MTAVKNAMLLTATRRSIYLYISVYMCYSEQHAYSGPTAFTDQLHATEFLLSSQKFLLQILN